MSEPSEQNGEISVCGRGKYRAPEDDFYCLRYGVWYPSIDCAFRTRYRTAPGCRDCEQGRFNLKRHARAIARPGRFRSG